MRLRPAKEGPAGGAPARVSSLAAGRGDLEDRVKLQKTWVGRLERTPRTGEGEVRSTLHPTPTRAPQGKGSRRLGRVHPAQAVPRDLVWGVNPWRDVVAFYLRVELKMDKQGI